MSISKILKIYFCFVMAVSSLAMLMYHTDFEYMVLSVLHIGEAEAVEIEEVSYSPGKPYTNINSNPSDVVFKMLDEYRSTYAWRGEENVNVMNYLLKADDEELILKDLRLKIDGVDPHLIDKVLMKGTGRFEKKGEIRGNYVIFDGLNYSVKKGEGEVLRFYIDLDSDIETGDRFRFNIEAPQDIVLYSGSDAFIIDGYYPIEGQYLSVVGNL